MTVILDYGIGNVSSIYNMMNRLGIQSMISGKELDVMNADKIILPGVGHFDYCMKQLKHADFFETLNLKVLKEKTPVLGVCVGCQMLMESSEEGVESGLGWVSGKVVKFNIESLPVGLKVPHMAWTDVDVKQNHRLYSDILDPRFYFVHSYHLLCNDTNDITATETYGYEFVASVQKGNIQGVQFHPEKSHKFGMKLYENFNRYF